MTDHPFFKQEYDEFGKLKPSPTGYTATVIDKVEKLSLYTAEYLKLDAVRDAHIRLLCFYYSHFDEKLLLGLYVRIL